LAAAALARAAGVPAAAIRDGIRAYQPGEHRIQVVDDDAGSGVLWINDSKATNPHAASASLASFQSVVWIAGGLSKGVSYDDLVARHADRLRAVVLLGADPAPLLGALTRHAPDVPVSLPPTLHTGQGHDDGGSADLPSGDALMHWAVAEAARIAGEGDTVLMAPAAASMDQFSSYAHRGSAFMAAVRARGGQESTAKES
jgi:UDP-N-acetylmuramoylalanine--D-glutamate ligase